MFINPGTIFVPLTPCHSAAINRWHGINHQPVSDTAVITEQRAAWCNAQANIDYIADLAALTGMRIPRDIDFDFAVELFTAHLRDGARITTAGTTADGIITPRYRIATDEVVHPIFGPGLVIVGAQHVRDVTRFIDDIMRYGEIVDPETGNAHMPVLHPNAVFDTARGGVCVDAQTAHTWCEVFSTTALDDAAINDTAPDTAAPVLPSSTIVTVLAAPGDDAQYTPTAVFNTATAFEFWMQHRHDNTAAPTDGAANRHSDETQQGITPPTNAAENADEMPNAPITVPDHTAAGYTMDAAKPFDDLLGMSLRAVAAQIERNSAATQQLSEAARGDRDATIATLTAAATMVEHQAQHSDATITDTVLENLSTISQRMEAHSAVFDDAVSDTVTNSAASNTAAGEQLEIPFDAIIDTVDTVDPADAVDPCTDVYGDDEISDASVASPHDAASTNETTAQPQLNLAEATLSEVVVLAAMRIEQFTNRAVF